MLNSAITALVALALAFLVLRCSRELASSENPGSVRMLARDNGARGFGDACSGGTEGEHGAEDGEGDNAPPSYITMVATTDPTSCIATMYEMLENFQYLFVRLQSHHAYALVDSVARFVTQECAMLGSLFPRPVAGEADALLQKFGYLVSECQNRDDIVECVGDGNLPFPRLRKLMRKVTLWPPNPDIPVHELNALRTSMLQRSAMAISIFGNVMQSIRDAVADSDGSVGPEVQARIDSLGCLAEVRRSQQLRCKYESAWLWHVEQAFSPGLFFYPGETPGAWGDVYEDLDSLEKELLTAANLAPSPSYVQTPYSEVPSYSTWSPLDGQELLQIATVAEHAEQKVTSSQATDPLSSPLDSSGVYPVPEFHPSPSSAAGLFASVEAWPVYETPPGTIQPSQLHRPAAQQWTPGGPPSTPPSSRPSGPVVQESPTVPPSAAQQSPVEPPGSSNASSSTPAAKAVGKASMEDDPDDDGLDFSGLMREIDKLLDDAE